MLLMLVADQAWSLFGAACIRTEISDSAMRVVKRVQVERAGLCNKRGMEASQDASKSRRIMRHARNRVMFETPDDMHCEGRSYQLVPFNAYEL